MAVGAREVLLEKMEEGGTVESTDGSAMSAQEVSVEKKMEEDGAMEDSADDNQCRICFETGGDLIAPCLCSGTSKWIHRTCLDQWRAAGSNARAMTNCFECGFQYRLIQDKSLTDRRRAEERQNCFRFSGWIIGRTVLSFVLVHLLLCTFTIILHACDRTFWGCTLVKVPWLAHPSGPPPEQYWDNLQYYKATYYLAAVLAVLCLLGISITIKYRKEFLEAFLTCGRSVRTCNCTSGGLVSSYWCMRGCITGFQAFGALGVTVFSFTFIGAFGVLILIVVMLQHAWHRYLAIARRQLITEEFQVVDLSAEEAPNAEETNNQAQQEITQSLSFDS